MQRMTARFGRNWRRRAALLALAPLLALAALSLTAERAMASPVATLTVSPDSRGPEGRHHVLEGTELVVTVKLASPSSWDVWVYLHFVHDQTNEADFGEDNDPFYGSFFGDSRDVSPYLLRFEANVTSRSWTLPILADGVDEGPEQFRVSIHANQLFFGGVRAIQTGTPHSQTVIIHERLPDAAYPVRANADGTFTVAPSWSLIPPGLTTGDRFRLIFRTTAFSATTSASIATYNAFVDRLAQNASIADYCCSASVSYRALASTPTVDARDNLGMWSGGWRDAASGVPIYWIGTSHAVATSYAALFGADGWSNGQHLRNQHGIAPTQYRDLQIGTGTAVGGQKASTGLLRPFGGAVGLELIEAGLLQSSADGVTAIAGSWRVEGKFLGNYHNTLIYGVSPVFVVGP